jgi:hypothetical protein
MIIQDNEPNVPEDPLIEDPCIAYRTKASVMDGLIKTCERTLETEKFA